MPDSPSKAGWNAQQIKAKIYEGEILIYNWIKILQTQACVNFTSLSTGIADNDTKINENYVTLDNKIDLTEGILTNNIAIEKNNVLLTMSNKDIAIRSDIVTGALNPLKYLDEDGNTAGTIKSILDNLLTLKNELSLGTFIVKNAVQDSKGNSIADTYATISSLNLLNTIVTSIINGDKVIGKALQDSEGNIISSSYINNNKIALSKDTLDTSKIPTLNVVNELINSVYSKIVNGSQSSLDTLKELADALGNDANFSTTITNLIAQKLSKIDAEQLYLTISNASSIYATKQELSNKQGNTTSTIKDVEDRFTTLDNQAIKTLNGIAPTNGNINVGSLLSVSSYNENTGDIVFTFSSNLGISYDEETGDLLINI